MLISPAGHVVVCTPKKCGTHSVNGLLEPSGFRVVSPWHRTDVPFGAADIRIMMIRNPYERFYSMFHFTRRCHSAYLNKQAKSSFNEWFDAFFSADKNDWTKTLSDYADEFKPKYLVRIDDPNWAGYLTNKLKQRFPSMYVQNKSPHRNKSIRFNLVISPAQRDKINEWAYEDTQRFGYEMPLAQTSISSAAVRGVENEE